MALLFCQSYLQSNTVINDFHQNVIVGFENEIVEKEIQRKKSVTYFKQLIEQQDKKEQTLASLVIEKTYLLQLARLDTLPIDVEGLMFPDLCPKGLENCFTAPKVRGIWVPSVADIQRHLSHH
jgi:hypothetical protein